MKKNQTPLKWKQQKKKKKNNNKKKKQQINTRPINQGGIVH